MPISQKNSLAGLRFGRLLVLEKTEERIRGAVVWKCVCSCEPNDPKYKYAPADMLKSGKVRSCGCLQNESRKAYVPATKGSSKYSTENVREIVSSFGCTLLSDYSNLKEPLHIQCSCGNTFYRTFPEFKRYNKKCPSCSYKGSQDKRRLSLLQVQTYLNGLGVKLLAQGYENKDTPLKVECKCGTVFYRTLGSFKTQGAHYCEDCSRYKSGFETEMHTFLQSVYSGTIVSRENSLIKPYQLDFYLPDKKIAVEANGLYYHTEKSGGKGRVYHLNKWKMTNALGIRLIHITDYEWKIKRELIQGLLLALLSRKQVKINTRDCTVTQITGKDSSEFLNTHHLQGNTGSKLHLGLLYQGELVAVMTFGKPRFNSTYDSELVRFCIKTGYHVPGAAEKLFSHYIKNSSERSVVSYCDISKFSGKVYEKLGFRLSGYSAPGYSYVKFSGGFSVSSRQKFQKHKLKDKLPVFNPVLSEWENMKANGYDRYWDCGNAIYTWERK